MKQAKQAIKLIRRSPYQAIAAVLAMSLTFFISSIFIILLVGGQIVLRYIEQRPTISVFFKNEVAETKINEIAQKIKSAGFARDVKYVSKEEALAIYKERFKDQPHVVELVSADFLPASLDIFVNKPQDVEEISKQIQNQEEISDVVYPKDVTQTLSKWTRILRIGGLTLVSTLMAVSFLIIIMVIGMRIALRREEISIMNLVGATKWYIAKPFIIEGILYGVVGATLATFLVYVLLLFYSPNIQQFLGTIQIFPISPLFFIYLWLGEMATAASIGIIGASIALFRYLKIK